MKKFMSKARVLDRTSEIYRRIGPGNPYRIGIKSNQIVALANALCEEVDRALGGLLAKLSAAGRRQQPRRPEKVARR